MWDDSGLPYLSGVVAPTASPAPAAPDSVWQRLGSAWGRDNSAGGGLAGLFAALSPMFSQGYSQGNKPLQNLTPTSSMPNYLQPQSGGQKQGGSSNLGGLALGAAAMGL
jgi:hypothetical protein